MSAAQFYNQQQPQQDYQQPYSQGQQNDRGYAPPPGPPPSGNYGIKPSQQYAQQQQPTPPSNQGNAEYGGGQPYGDTAPFSQANEKTGERFKPKTRLNDPIFLVLFIAAVAGFAVLSGIAIKSFISVNGLGGGLGNSTQGGTGSGVTLNYHTVYLLLCVCALGLAIAVLWMAAVRAFTKVIMEVTLALTVLLNIAICIYYFYIRYWSGAVIFLIIALLSVVFYWSMRKRIPLAKLFLQTVVDITKHHPTIYLIALLFLVVQTAISIWYSFTCVAIYVKWTPDSSACTGSSCSSSKVAGLIFYATFAYYWITQVMSNVLLCTLAGGVFGGWYYYGPRSANGGVPKGASLKAFVRAITLSLGSIAFGSLIVTILELLRTLLQIFEQQQSADGDIMGQILACCAVCCISFISWTVQFFNKYAYIEISLYGKAYIPAAKDTWHLLTDRGIDALVNDNLVGTVVLWGSYLNGFLCGLFGYLYLRFTHPSYNTDGQYSAPVILFSFAIGMSLSYTIGSVLESGVSTIFVGLGEDPMVLADRSPGLFELIRQEYPHVVQGVPHNS